MSFGPKHQRKVNECYPVRAGEEGAVSGKITVLTYYINAKPEKLLKVSAYLEKKVKKDVQRERTGYNKVTLDIVEGIMEGCGEYFGSFAMTALSIIDTLSQSTDVELLTRVSSTFVQFSKMAKGLMPSIREEAFFDLLTKVLEHLCVLSSLSTSPEDLQSIREGELRTVVAAVGMEDFRAHGGKDRLAIVLRSIMSHFMEEGIRRTISADLKGSIDPEMPSANEKATRLSAAFQQLIKGLSSSSLPIFMEVFFTIYAGQKCDGMQSTWLAFQLLIKHIPSGFLCIVLTELFRQLEHAQEPALSMLLDVLAELLLSNRGPLGYTAVDIATNLIRLLRKQKPQAPSGPRKSFLIPSAAETEQPPPSRSVFAICNCLVSILRNTNFASQKYDILNHIIHRAFLPRETSKRQTHILNGSRSSQQVPSDHISLATVTLDNAEEIQFRAVIWSVLFAMAEESLPATLLKLAFVEIPQRLFDSLLMMIVNFDSEFRLSSLVLLHRLFLNGLSFTGHSNKRDSLPAARIVHLPKGGLVLLAKFRGALYKSVQLENTQSTHVCAIDGLLKAALREADYQHYLLSALLLASLPLLTRQRNLERQVLMQLLLHGYLKRLGEHTGNGQMSENAQEMLAAMRKHGVHVFDLEDALDDYPPPLCLRSSEDPKVDEYQLSFGRLRKLFMAQESITEEQKVLVEQAFSVHSPYSPDKDLEVTAKDYAARSDLGRRSLFPASPKRPLPGSESSSATVLAHRRSLINMFPCGQESAALTVPSYQDSTSLTKHQLGSSVSVASQLSRASSLKKNSNRSTESFSIASSEDGSDMSVLEGNFTDLTLRNQERAKERSDRLFVPLLVNTRPAVIGHSTADSISHLRTNRMINWIIRHLTSMTDSRKEEKQEEEIMGPKYMGMMMGFNDSCELVKKREIKKMAAKDSELESISRTERFDSTGAPEVSLQPINLTPKIQSKKQIEFTQITGDQAAMN